MVRNCGSFSHLNMSITPKDIFLLTRETSTGTVIVNNIVLLGNFSAEKHGRVK